MERKIEVKRKDKKSLDTFLLKEQLSRVFGLRNPLAVEYQEGSTPEFGILILRPEGSYDVQEVGYIISTTGYATIPSNSKLNSQVKNFGEMAKTFGVLRERIKQGSIRLVRGLEETRNCNGPLKEECTIK